MSYIGRQNLGGAYRQLDDISSGFDGSDTTHTMQVNSQNVTVGDVNQIILSLGGVIQKPGTDFTVSGSVLTFTTAPAANTSFFAVLLGSDNGGTITPTDASVTASKLASDIAITTSGNTSLDGGSFVFNESGADKDFRIEGDTQANLFVADASTDRVGIGTNAPDMLLDVTGSVSAGGGSDENLQQWNIASDNVKASMEYVDDSATRGMRFAVDSAHALHLGTEGSTNIYIQAGGQTFVNRTTPNQGDHQSGAKERLGATETSSARNSLYLSNTSGSFGSYHQRNDADRAANSAYGFFIGSSGNESDNEIRMMGDGSIYSDGGNNLGSGADYAEYFEWKDGNSSDEDRRGYSVVLDGNKIVKATDSDDASKIIGVISGNPAVVGDSAWNKWNQKHLKDDFNTYIWEDHTHTEWKNANGDTVGYQTDLIPDDVTVPDDAVVISKENDGVTNLKRRKVNPSWDATATYIPRSDRKEWDTVGLMGKLRLRKGQPTGSNWIKMRDISDTVEEWLVR
jgi:hypothetical protein